MRGGRVLRRVLMALPLAVGQFLHAGGAGRDGE